MASSLAKLRSLKVWEIGYKTSSVLAAVPLPLWSLQTCHCPAKGIVPAMILPISSLLAPGSRRLYFHAKLLERQ